MEAQLTDEEIRVTEQLEGLLAQEPEDTRYQKTMIVHEIISENAWSLRNFPDKKAYVRDLYKKADEEVKKTIKEYPPSCKKGCAFCCHIEVKCTDVEADIIMDNIKDEPFTDEEVAMLERQSLIPEKGYSLYPDRACVFLTEDNECSVYDVRPMACRTYLVKSPASKCEKMLEGKDGVWVIASIQGELMRSILYSGLPSGRLCDLLLNNHKKQQYEYTGKQKADHSETQ